MTTPENPNPTNGISLARLIARLPQKMLISAPTTLPEIAITGIEQDSRKVQPGQLFVCLPGQHQDGHRYAAAAVERGAAAIVAEKDGLQKAENALPTHIPVITVKKSHHALPLLACEFYGDPSHTMRMVGVTGTNGKTTTTRMIAHILRTSGIRVGTIGTLGAEVDGEAIPSDFTTPEPLLLQSILAEMRAMGAEAVVMEVSSHALALHRTDGIAYNVGVFTNLTQDHLDFHGTMEAYFEAKARLFTEYPVLYPRPDKAIFASILNVKDWEGRLMVSNARGDILTYTAGDMAGQMHALNIELGTNSASFLLDYDTGVEHWQLPIALPIGGAFQVSNALAAIGAALKLGVDRETVAHGLATLPPVPGRFESVPNEKGYTVVVDYAHTPDGLENVLRSARELNPARLLCVFGCGGNRDRTKRPIMGRLAATLADIAIVTSDNPRHEEPNAIIEDILTGMDRTRTNGTEIDSSEIDRSKIDSSKIDSSKIDGTETEKIETDRKEGEIVTAEIHVEPDRYKAIALALSLTRPGDILVIAGKGHENYQIIGDTKHHFDDREVVQELLRG